MKFLELIMLASLVSSGGFFLISFILSIRKNVLWLKFMAFGLLNLAISSALLIYFNGIEMANKQIENLVIAAVSFICLAALFYLAHQFNEE